MNRPDITLVQKIALVLPGIPLVLQLLSVDLSAEQDGALDKLIVLAVGAIVGDAAIRVGRNLGDGKAASAGVLAGQGSDAAFPESEVPQ